MEDKNVGYLEEEGKERIRGRIELKFDEEESKILFKIVSNDKKENIKVFNVENVENVNKNDNNVSFIYNSKNINLRLKDIVVAKEFFEELSEHLFIECEDCNKRVRLDVLQNSHVCLPPPPHYSSSVLEIPIPKNIPYLSQKEREAVKKRLDVIINSNELLENLAHLMADDLMAKKFI